MNLRLKRKSVLVTANVVLMMLSLAGLSFSSKDGRAEVQLNKKVILKQRGPAAVHALMHVSKAGTSLKVELVELSKTVDGDGYMIDLQANVTAETKLEDVKFNWNLPPEAKIIAGFEDGDLGSLGENSAVNTKISVHVPADFNRKIHFHVYRDVAGEPHGQVAQYNTLDQSSIDEGLRTKADILSQKEESGEELKVIQ
jgi:hypothetical protein